MKSWLLKNGNVGTRENEINVLVCVVSLNAMRLSLPAGDMVSCFVINKQCGCRVWPTWAYHVHMPPLICNPNLWPFDLETSVWVAYTVGNLHSKFGHARPLGSRIIRYVCDGWTVRQTDWQKQHLLPFSLWLGHNCHFLYGWGIIIIILYYYITYRIPASQ